MLNDLFTGVKSAKQGIFVPRDCPGLWYRQNFPTLATMFMSHLKSTSQLRSGKAVQLPRLARCLHVLVRRSQWLGWLLNGVQAS